MWLPATRKNYSRHGLRYQSDVTDEEWRVIAPLSPAKETGRPRAWPLREIVDGIFYVMRCGCPWRQLPKDLPPLVCSLARGLPVREDQPRPGDGRPRAGRARGQPLGGDHRQLEHENDRGRGSAWPRCRQEGQGAQASCSGRHRRTRPLAATASSQHSGPRPRWAALASLPPLVSLHSSGFLPIAAMPASVSPPRPASSSRSSPKPRSDWLCALAAPMGGRALLRLDRPQPQARQGLRGNHRFRPSLPLRSVRHAALTPHRQSRISFKTDSEYFAVALRYQMWHWCRNCSYEDISRAFAIETAEVYDALPHWAECLRLIG